MPNPFKQTASRIERGHKAEAMACQYLIDAGLHLREKNYRCKMGEIDLIMRDHAAIVFVEVRFRRQSRYGSGTESVDGIKQRKLLRTAQHYLQAHQLNDRYPVRFDVIGMSSEGNTITFNWIRNAIET